ncbi:MULTISPECIES: glycosyltransferase family 4 protein [Marinobacter]|uniref:Glycosyltransferase family 4 protein n=1 Tax=Marinobacter suaedae TaxID=3057675 RepID=A0ABT8W4T2_9GAMM|nr:MULTISPECIES: glycosyltransferase family 4 protein [unclassified Marinobacter]MBZ2170168.1 glycosyltransferase family 4 protein [Marinobacter sp. F4216]MDO3723216.1 glycosyltransferase family 4 protein [Marinobacter sp. chi1]
MRVLQALPALHSGGVERGTVEFAAELVKREHESFVVSNGGPMVQHLHENGSTHVQMPIHRKSPASFGQILPMRRLIRRIRPDIIHVRSRMPAWIIHLAWLSLPAAERPLIVSTFHGMYSVNPYSAVMTKANHIIAVSNCVRDYVLNNFNVAREKLTVIQRGVDVDQFREHRLDPSWTHALLATYPQLKDQKILMMPGRISRWKGQLTFLEVMAQLIRERNDCHGIIVGGAEPGKEHFMEELKKRCEALGLSKHVTFLGQRNDMAELYLLSDLVCHLSTKPEPFGRTVTEALASGTPVAAFNRGGAAETLQACFREGLVTPDDTEAFTETVVRLLDGPTPDIQIPDRFRLEAQTEATLRIYQQLVTGRRALS